MDRLPTEAEWEYACRAGTVTSRDYGHPLDLLDTYARYQANSEDHAWMCGSLLPNDLGLFDILGNEYEWCQNIFNASRKGKKKIHNDNMKKFKYVIEKTPRIVRGAAFDSQPAYVRSAYRNWHAPANRGIGDGFRPSRTY